MCRLAIDDCCALWVMVLQCVLIQDHWLGDPGIRRRNVFSDGNCAVCSLGNCKHLSMRLHVEHLSTAYRRLWGCPCASLSAVTNRRLSSRFNGFVINTACKFRCGRLWVVLSMDTCRRLSRCPHVALSATTYRRLLRRISSELHMEPYRRLWRHLSKRLDEPRLGPTYRRLSGHRSQHIASISIIPNTYAVTTTCITHAYCHYKPWLE